MIFVRKDTGEEQEFLERTFEIDKTNQLSARKEKIAVTCFKTLRGYRIDRDQDGVYRDKWGGVWEPKSTQN